MSVDDSITRALLRKSNEYLAASNPMVDYGTIDVHENAKEKESNHSVDYAELEKSMATQFLP